MSNTRLEITTDRGFCFPKEILHMGGDFRVESQTYGEDVEKDVYLECGDLCVDLDTQSAQALADFLLKHLNVKGNK